MKKVIVALAMLLVMTGVLTACGGEDYSLPGKDDSSTDPSIYEDLDDIVQPDGEADDWTNNESEPEVQQKPETQPKPEVQKQPSSAGVSPQFKATMDSYEDFFDEYIAFMKKYENSNDMASLLPDYLRYMEKYMETMDELEKIGDRNLSEADELYFIEVQSRINQKLVAAAY